MRKLQMTLLSCALISLSAYAGFKVYNINNPQIVKGDNDTQKEPSVIKDMSADIEDVFSSLVGTKNTTDADIKDMPVNYDNAKKINHDTIGWIVIDGTNINYPIMHGSNSYYLNRSWDKKRSRDGSIFLEESQAGFQPVTLIHGHNMLNNKMFSQLERFKSKDFFNDGHLIYIYDGKALHKYKVISAFLTDPSINLSLGLTDSDGIKDYASTLTKKSMFGTRDVTGKNLLILNTCMSDGTQNHLIVISQEV